jgi:tRNA-specific 2-thiouridylase
MDAQRAANVIGIPYYVWDFSERFKEDVVDDFIAEYQAGRTPNPCLRCNERIKFSALLEKALALGFDALCTGHYATIERDDAGNPELHRSLALAKDQSYVLGVLTKEQLEHAYFPIGATASKDQIRAEADARGLMVANKPDSYDICFIPEGDTQDWINDKLGVQPGQIVDQSGLEVGEHPGYHSYTVGQRKGLNLGRPAADGKPRFVLEIRPKTNQVVVGPKEALAVTELAGSRISWCGVEPAAVEEFADAQVQVRAHGEAVECQFAVVAGELVIRLNEPLIGVSPGQSAVLYQGTRVLGQTTIDRTVSAQSARAQQV